jgi:hypothetical protein
VFEEDEPMPLILLLIAAAVLFKFAWLLAAVVVTAAVGWALGKWLARRDDAAVARRRRDAEVCARADRQHAAVLAGDLDAGVFGDYLPAAI